MKNKLPVFKKEKEAKVVCSIRLAPSIKDRLIVKHGTLQHAIEYMVSLNLDDADEDYNYNENPPKRKRK